MKSLDLPPASLRAKALLQFLKAIVGDQRILLQALQLDDVRPPAIGLHRLDQVQVHNVALVRSEEDFIRQALVQLGHAVGHHVARAVLHQQYGGAVLPHHHGDVGHIHKADALPVPNHHATGHGADVRHLADGGLLLGLQGMGHSHGLHFPAPQALADPAKGLHRPLHPEGLHQIVESVHLEGARHVLLVGRGKHQHRARVPVLYGACAIDTAHLGHLHVQQHHLGPLRVVQPNQFRAIRCLADQLVALGLLHQLAHHQAHTRVIIGDQYCNRYH